MDDLFQSLGRYAQEEFGFKRPPTLNLLSDEKNEIKLLGKTAYYDPQNMSISIYVDGRHPKDILRSFAHELVHHTQNENGQLEIGGYDGPGYAQKNKNLRNMEKDAYERGNMCFRDWEDQIKQEKPTIYNERRIYKMSTKKWKNKELSENISKKFGIQMNLGALNESKHSKSKDYKQGYSDAMAGFDPHEGIPDDAVDDYMEGYKAGEKEKLMKEGEIPAGLKKYQDEQAAKKKGKDSDKDEKTEEEKKDEKPDEDGGLKNPDKADLDKDGKLSSYEKKRGKAIEKNMKEQKLREAIKRAILKRINKKK